MAKKQPETTHETDPRAADHSLVPVADNQENSLGAKIATVAVVGLGVALIEVELIPGMLIGAAAVLAPNLLPGLGNALRPLLKTGMKAGYALASKTKETMAEAGEQFQDLMAEAKSESQADEPTPAVPPASRRQPA